MLQRLTREVYEERIAKGIAREQARKDLPLSTYTEAYWKIDLHNLFHFLFLRMDRHAQYEIRKYAETIGYEIVAKWCPVAWEAFLITG
jgi:thymidylate synthase (FAD)